MVRSNVRCRIEVLIYKRAKAVGSIITIDGTSGNPPYVVYDTGSSIH